MTKSPDYFIHENALCESRQIGDKTRIWAFAHVLPGAKIGQNCNICDHVFIENDVVLGDNVTVKCGVQLWDGVRIQDNVFIGPNVTFTNDLFPRSKIYPEKWLTTTVERDASIGANATLLPGIVIGRGAMIGAGAVVTRHVPPYTVVAGNPASIIRFIKTEQAGYSAAGSQRKALKVKGCEIWHLPSYTDIRGSVMVNEFETDLPFRPRRCFFVHNTESDKIRGEHAHRSCDQFLIALHGTVSAEIDDGVQRETIILNSPYEGLYMPAGTWGVQNKFSPDAVLCVYASEPYSDADYIRDYSEFMQFVENKKSTATV